MQNLQKLKKECFSLSIASLKFHWAFAVKCHLYMCRVSATICRSFRLILWIEVKWPRSGVFDVGRFVHTWTFWRKTKTFTSQKKQRSLYAVNQPSTNFKFQLELFSHVLHFRIMEFQHLSWKTIYYSINRHFWIPSSDFGYIFEAFHQYQHLHSPQ